MAVSYLTGNESPTAARMNALWSEADSIIDKAMDGKSLLMLKADTTNNEWVNLFTGKFFYFYTASSHTAAGISPLHAAEGGSIPTIYNQATHDSAVSGASFGSYNSSNYTAPTTTDINLDASLKAHTVSYGGADYFVWDKGQPAPEKRWKYAVAELVVGDSSANVFEIPDTYDKFNCFKIHNMCANSAGEGVQITVHFGTASSSHHTLSIPAWGQKCVRRDSVSSGYDSSYKYFFKCNQNDPRYLFFDSHSGSISQTMRANNITNASFLYNIMEVVGQFDFRDPKTMLATVGKGGKRITFDPSAVTDIGSAYASAGHTPTISDSTTLADLVFHKGKIGYRRKETSGSAIETGTIDFDGWSSFASNLTAAGLSSGTATSGTYEDRFGITQTSSFVDYQIWPLTTNALLNGDAATNYQLASGTAWLWTRFEYPYKLTSSDPEGVRPMYVHHFQKYTNGTRYPGHQRTVGNLKSNISTYSNAGSIDNKSVALTTEGPLFLYREIWNIRPPEDTSSGFLATANPSGNCPSWFYGLNRCNYYDMDLSGSTLRLLIHQDWPINTLRNVAAYSGGLSGADVNYVYGYKQGWPTKWKDSFFNWSWGTVNGYDLQGKRFVINAHPFHRMFEGPRKVRLYETTSGTNYPHKDIASDPAGVSGADFNQNNIGALTATSIGFQTNDIDVKVESFTAGDTDVPNYPRFEIDDAIKTMESTKDDSTFSTSKTAGEYNRINLLKEHYNDLVTLLKKATKIRPLTIDEARFGGHTVSVGSLGPGDMASGGGYLFDQVAPMDCLDGFPDGSDLETFYTALGVTVRDKDDFPNDIYTDADDVQTNKYYPPDNAYRTDQFVVGDWRWVKIDDVKSRATALGFKFRFENVSVPVDWSSTYTYPDGTTDSIITDYTFITSRSGTSNWKKPLTKAFLTGFDYIWETAHDGGAGFLWNTVGGGFYQFQNFYLINNTPNTTWVGIEWGRGLNKGIVIHCYDTSRTASGARARIGIDPIFKEDGNAGPGGTPAAGWEAPTDSPTITDITADETYFFPDESDHHYGFMVQVNPPVTYSA